MEELGNLFVEKDFGRIAIDEKIENLENYENLGVHHHMGGTRIGIDQKNSVVNQDLKLHNSKIFTLLGALYLILWVMLTQLITLLN